MHRQYFVKCKTKGPILTFQKRPIAACQVFVSSGTLKQESKFVNVIIRLKCDYKTVDYV